MEAKCIRFYKFGNPIDVLKVEHTQVERPKDKKVLVRMIARPINPSDLIPIRGAYSHRTPLPNVPGYEGVGIVEDVGSAVSKELIGKRVLPLRGEGTWQELVKTTVDWVVPVPDSIDDVTAAQMYINPITAWVICTEVLNLKLNDVLLVNACGSSIGHIFAQLANALGFQLLAVTRSDTYTKDLLELGAAHVINTSEEPLYETVMKLTKGIGAHAAIDSIGGSDGNELAFSLRENGNFLTIGLLSGRQVNWTEIVNTAKANANIFHLRHWNSNVSVDQWQGTFRRIINLIEYEKLRLMPVHSKYDLSDIKKAVCVAETTKTKKGKVFLTSN